MGICICCVIIFRHNIYKFMTIHKRKVAHRVADTQSVRGLSRALTLRSNFKTVERSIRFFIYRQNVCDTCVTQTFLICPCPPILRSNRIKVHICWLEHSIFFVVKHLILASAPRWSYKLEVLQQDTGWCRAIEWWRRMVV